MNRNISLTTIILLVICFFLGIAQCSYAKKQTASNEKIKTQFEKLSIEQLNATIKKIEVAKEKNKVITIHGVRMRAEAALDIAHKIKGDKLFTFFT